MSLKYTLTLALLLCSVSLSTAVDNIEPIAPYDRSTYHLSDPLPEQITPTGNPLDWAGAKIGLDVRGYELPRGHEGEYRFNCRFPIIDYVSYRPLYMKQWAEDNSSAIGNVQRTDGIGAVAMAVEILTGATGQDGSLDYADNRAVTPFKVSLAGTNLTHEYQTILLKLFSSYTLSAQTVKVALDGLQPEDRDYFTQNPVAYLLPDGKKMANLTGNNEEQPNYQSRLRRANLTAIVSAGEYLAEAIREYLDATATFTLSQYYSDISLAGADIQIDTPYGVVLIAGTGDSHHVQDIPFLIDIAGNDRYTNNSGGAVQSVALCIDHLGNDIYDTPSKRYTQGSGVLGVGILADLSGDDRYTAHHFSQGAGVAGVGVLFDQQGDDTYSADGFVQGAGMFGLGILLDNAGNDSYDCSTLGQGGATALGLGCLSDLAGNDKYKLGADTGKDNFASLSGYGQGGALSFRPSPWRGKLTPYGGVGLLTDAKGNDSYVTAGWCDQGGSYIMSLGALVDSDGDDNYKAGTGQGSGIHITNAILIDKAGNDTYQGGFRTGGSGSDRSPGILLDYSGNDIYRSGSSSYGTGCKPFSYSLMIDYCGEDQYITANPVGPILFNCWDSFGGVWPESAPHLYPYAIMMDLGGMDDYQVRNRSNNSVRHSFGHGVHIDMDYVGEEPIGTVNNGLAPYSSLVLPSSLSKSQYSALITRLASPNLFTRFSAVGSITNGGTGIIPTITDLLMTSTHKQFNRDLMECLHTLLAQKKVEPKYYPNVANLVNAADSEVRTITADNIGVFELTNCEPQLLSAMNDLEPQVRRFALRSLLSQSSKAGLDIARKQGLSDQSEDVRRIAVIYSYTIRDSVDPYPLLIDKLENDSSSAVRCVAVDGLGRLGISSAIPVLRKYTGTEDPYLQRAIGKALCELYQIDGIDLLINSLTFPSIDAFFNYDYNVANFLSTYTGHDFPDPDRFDQAKWRSWFDANRETIPLRTNIEASRAYTALIERLRGADDKTLITALEQYISDYPANRTAAGVLATNLNRIAWDMATAPANSPSFNPKQAIIYSKRSVELVNEVNYWDTVAEAYFADKDFAESARVCKEQLVKYPGNAMFTERLERIAKENK